MNIAIVSDTHGNLDDVKKFLDKVRAFDYVIHLGDYASDGLYLKKYFNGRFIGVRGNCDFNTYFPDEVVTNIGEKRFFITHGHRYNVKMNLLNLKFKAISENADITLFGHTHQIFKEKVNHMIYINPGSLSQPRFTDKKTYCIIDIDEDTIKYEIKEL